MINVEELCSILIMSKNYLGWIDKNIDKQKFENRNVFITGGNSGVGFELAKYCAYLNANVFLLCRSLDKAQAARKEIISEYPRAKVNIIRLDLADRSSIEECVNEIKKHDVNMFMNNAGVFRLPKSYTKDGFEIVMGTNFLGTYYLNYLLMPYLSSLPHKVNVSFMSSIGAKLARINLNDIFMDKKYKKMKIYFNSKLAMNCIYDNFVDENIENINFSLTHPGVTYTPLINKGYKTRWFHALAKGFMKVAFHSSKKAALSGLKALEMNKQCKIGPRGLFGISGYPGKWRMRRYKHSEDLIRIANDLLKI